MMSQHSSVRAAPNAIDIDRILDAAYELVLAVGLRRMTMADIARRADVSRATLYRRWPNVHAVVAALMTREWSVISDDAPASGRSARRRLVTDVVSTVDALRDHPIMRKIVDVDPEFLLPYVVERRGRTTQAQLAALESSIAEGQTDRSVRSGDPATLARAVLLTAMSFVLSADIMTDDTVRRADLDAELRTLLDRYLAP